MESRHCGMLPVIGSVDDRTVIGVVTDRDLCMKVVAYGRDAIQVRVAECMSDSPVCCNREDDVHKVLGLMAGHRVRRVLVVDHAGTLQGVVSLTDLLESEAMTNHEVAYVLAQIDAAEERREQHVP
jgi:predicted transcriptional regulator